MKKRILSKEEIQNIETKIKLYDRAININSRDNKIYYIKALELIKLDRNEEALECLNTAISISPDLILYRAQKANLFANLERYNDAKIELSKIKLEDLSNDAYDKHIKEIIINVQNKVLEIGSKTNENGKHNDDILNESSFMQVIAELKNRIVVLEKENKQFKGELNYLENSVKELVSILQDDSSTEENYEQTLFANGEATASSVLALGNI